MFGNFPLIELLVIQNPPIIIDFIQFLALHASVRFNHDNCFLSRQPSRKEEGGYGPSLATTGFFTIVLIIVYTYKLFTKTLAKNIVQFD